MMGKDFVSLSLFLASVRAVKDWKVDQAKGLGSNPSYNTLLKMNWAQMDGDKYLLFD